MTGLSRTQHGILLVSSGVVHPSLPARYALHRFLAGLDGFAVRKAHSVVGLSQIDLSRYGAVVLYFHRRTIAPVDLSALEQYVSDGGGLVAIHSAAASFKGHPGYRTLLGGKFTTHGPVKEMSVLPVSTGSSPGSSPGLSPGSSPGSSAAAGIYPDFGGICSFRVRDELYIHEYESDNRIHFCTMVNGRPEPLVWTRQKGRGRVGYLALGHTAGTIRHPAFQAILHATLKWVTDATDTGDSGQSRNLPTLAG